MDILEYVEKYGDITFSKRKFNDVDNLVFSLLSYLNFTYTSINESDHTLEYVGREYLKTNDFKDVKKLGISQKLAYKLIRKLIKKKRYKDLLVHNYIYSYSDEKQFSAMMIRINSKLEYMSFEGTDELVSGWKEDFELSYKFPIPAQKDAIRYANKYIKVKGPDIIMGGHSKGGNLAIVASMYTSIVKQFRIKKIYNNDGPGLSTRELESSEYKRIRKKIIHYVPEHSVVGILLRHETMNVIKSNRSTILAHSIGSWVLDDNGLIPSKLSKRSQDLHENLLMWLSSHSDEEKKRVVNAIFGIFEKSKVKKFYELANFNNIKEVIANARNIDDHSKELFDELLRYYFLRKK